MSDLEVSLARIAAARAAGRISAEKAESMRKEAGNYTPAYGTLLVWEGGVGYCAFTGNPVEW